MRPRLSAGPLLSLALFALAAWVACSSSPSQNALPVGSEGSAPKKGHHHHARPGAYGDVISHIFIIVQENRSLENLFSGFAGANAPPYGCLNKSLGSGSGSDLGSGPGLGSGSGSCPPADQSVQLKPIPLATSLDIDHCYFDAATAIDGSSEPMDGFNGETLLKNGGEVCGKGSKQAGMVPYAYVQQKDIKPYWDIANNWVLAANFFPTELGPSFVAHLNLLAGTTETVSKDAVADFPQGPWGCSAPKQEGTRHLTPTQTPGPYSSPYPCFDQFHSVADLLDGIYSSPQVKVPWRYYAPTVSNGGYIWSAFQAFKRVYTGPDWKNDLVTPPGQILLDIPAGKLNNIGVTWVVPNFVYSDHAGPTSTDEGPSWVGDVVNAIGASPLWSSSVIVVLWDDWGGWYDNAAPPPLDFRGYGVRTPMLILSPYAKKSLDSGTVAMTRFEPGSILRFIEQVFAQTNLGSLPCGASTTFSCDIGYTDKNANSIGSVLDTTQNPRAYGTPIPTKYPPKFFEPGGSGYNAYSYYPPDGE
jgi:phospholipase C